MKSVLMGLLGAGAIGAVGICELCPPDAVAATPTAASVAVIAVTGRAEMQAASAVAPDTQTVRLRIEGMTCGGCAISARIVLERLDGVEKADVSYEVKLAVVTYDPEKITPERMIEALEEKLRYTATVVEPKDP